MPRQHLTGFQRVPVENPFCYRSVANGGFLEDGTSLLRTYRVASVYWDGYSWCWGLMHGGKLRSARRTRAYYLLGCSCAGRGFVKVKPIAAAGTIG